MQQKESRNSEDGMNMGTTLGGPSAALASDRFDGPRCTTEQKRVQRIYRGRVWRYARRVIRYETKDWLRTVLQFRGTVLPRVIGRTVAVAVISAVALVISRETTHNLAIPATAHAMVGVALGLLLVFRTNASYGRFWEGRILVGGVVNNCRDLARQSSAYMRHLPDEERRKLAGWIAGFAALASAGLREEPTDTVTGGLFSDEEAAELSTAEAPTLVVSRWLTEFFVAEADAGRLDEVRLRTLDTAVSDLVDKWGGCERILRTPVPFAYAHHIKSFLTIFCFTAPLTMIGPMGWYAPLAGAVVAFGLYGIDEIGVEIEDPFGRDANDLPLDDIVDELTRNVRESLRVS